MFNLNFLCSCLTQYFLSYPHWIRKTTYSFPLLSAYVYYICSPPQPFLQKRNVRAFLPVLVVCVCWVSGYSQCSLLDLFCLESSLNLKGLATNCLHCFSCEKSHCILSKHPQNGLCSPSHFYYMQKLSHSDLTYNTRVEVFHRSKSRADAYRNVFDILPVWERIL